MNRIILKNQGNIAIEYRYIERKKEVSKELKKEKMKRGENQIPRSQESHPISSAKETKKTLYVTASKKKLIRGRARPNPI